MEAALYEAELALHNGDPALGATQVYRRDGGQWRVAHRHADTVTD